MRWAAQSRADARGLVDCCLGTGAKMAKHVVCGTEAGAHAGPQPGAPVGGTGDGDVLRQRRLDALDALQMADEVLRDRSAEALDAQLDRRATQPQGRHELAMDRGRELAVADSGHRRAGPAHERLHDRRIAAQVLPLG
jgi:hypothetical protein